MTLQENIRRILREQSSMRSRLKSMIQDFGIINTAQMVGGVKNLFNLLNIKDPMDFLHLFDDLEVVQSEKLKDLILFRYKPKYNFMIYDTKNEEVYINYDEIWSFLRSNFGLNYQETQGLTKEWLDEVYNLRGVTSLWDHRKWHVGLD